MNRSTENDKSRKGRKKLGELLVASGLIDEKTLAKALEVQTVQKKKLGRILIDMGVADDETIARALAGQLNIPFMRLKNIEIASEIISLVSSELADGIWTKVFAYKPVNKAEL